MADRYRLHVFPNDQQLVAEVAQRWIHEVWPLCAARSDSRPVCVALSGGRIASRYFTSIKEASRQEGSPPKNLHFFWADERCVPPSHPQSNYADAARALLTPLGIAEKQIHRIQGELNPDAATKLADAAARSLVTPDKSGMAIFDLVLLGMGEDGHVASLFPEHKEGLATSIYCSVSGSPKPPPNRISLTYRAIAAAANVWVIASGSDKKRVLYDSLSEKFQTPLAQVIKSRASTEILTDIAGR